MRAVVVYESMYGATHLIANAIGKGLSEAGEVTVVRVGSTLTADAAAADLVVVGGPTHVHTMSRPSSRRSAAQGAANPGSPYTLEPQAEGIGVREWLEGLTAAPGQAAAFDTRIDLNPVMTGRASKGIAKQLHKHGMQLVAPPESFLVTKAGDLVDGEEERAVEWGRHRAAAVAGVPQA